jgi:Tol biopolymer transport system component
MPAAFQFRYTGCLFLMMVTAAIAAAKDEQVSDSGPAWPDNANQQAAPLEDRFRQFDRALEFLREQLVTLQQDIDHGAAGVRPVVRRNDPGFRGLYTMHPDGTKVEYLTSAPGMISSADPQWSHDGTMVAFGAVPEFDNSLKSKIYVYAVEGPFKGRIREYGYGNTPAWSPDDKRIAYMINPGNPIEAQGGTWIMDSDGTNRRWIGDGMFPRWSPDGKQLLCDGGQTLLVYDVFTGKQRQLLSAPGWTLKLYGGNWSPDGKHVAFVGTFQDKDRLALIDADGNSIRNLYVNDDPGKTLCGPPAWSPDGKQIVFSIQDNVAGSPRDWWHSYLYSIAADAGEGVKPALLEGKKVGNINRGMAFSPDGKKIIFSSER